MEPLISVIVPVYNVEKYINKCIDSILAQTYKNLEIILVDDGSPDRCDQICDEYAEKDNRVRVIHKKNEGQAVARNYALEICKGDYIAFVDSDDFIEADMFEVMLNAISQGDYDVAVCGAKFCECKTGRIQSVSYVNRKLSGDASLLIKRYLTGKVRSVMWDKIYRAELFKTVRFPSLRCREDAYVLPELLGEANGFVEIPDCKYIQNIREGSTEQKAFDLGKLEATVAVYEHQREYIKANYPQYCSLTELMMVKMYRNFLSEVVVKNNTREKDDVYIKLFEGFKEEISKVNIKILDDKETEEFKKCMGIIDSPKKFYMICLRERLVYRFKKAIKSLIGVLRGIA